MTSNVSAGGISLPRRLRALFIAALTCGVASGCSSPALDQPPGVPGEPSNPGDALAVKSDLGERVSAWAKGNTLTVTTVGSGSCPIVPELQRISGSENLVELSTSIPGQHGNCTADLAPRTFEIDAGRDLTGFTVSVTSPS